MLTQGIREEASRLGFFKVGFVRAGPLPGRDRFDEWLRAGMHGEMAYLERQAPKRRDPSLVLAHARSLVVAAMNYGTGGEFRADSLRGRISRYAWGDDYHRVVTARLERLLAWIRAEAPGANGLCYVDTGPLMEKTWAAHSALGWLGKNANVIAREQGSWFFLGVILLDLELEYDAKEEDHCGTCAVCLPACPTGAIVRPYVVDARRCISYLTIELRGSIPRQLRPLIGNRIFGCDDCQEVCPWNRFAVPSGESSFRPREGNLMPELAPLVSIGHLEFSRLFKGSPVRRARRDGFVRNVVVALGNSGDRAALGPLSLALRDSSPLVRTHAAWAVGRIGGPHSRAALEEARAAESSPDVLEEINVALNSLP